jgi:hypothetical protein
MDSRFDTLLTELLEGVENAGKDGEPPENNGSDDVANGDVAVDVQTIGAGLSTADSEESNAIVSSLDGISLSDDLLKASLDDLLLGLIAARGGACGKTLRSDLFTIGYDISPGTLYPHLHDLESDGVLTKHEGVKTKEFRLANPDPVRDHFRDRIRDLFALAIALEIGRANI